MFLSFTMVASAEKSEAEIQANINYMYKEVAEKVAKLLKEDPNFLPFAAGMDVNGKVSFIWTDKKQKYTPDGAMYLMRNALVKNAQAGRLLGTAMTYRYARDANSPQQVTTELEYANGYAVARAFEVIDNQGELTPGRASEQKIASKVYTEELINKLKK